MFSKLKKLFKGVELPKQHAIKERTDVTPKAETQPEGGERVPSGGEGLERQPAIPGVPRLPEPKRNRKGIRVIDKHLDVSVFFQEAPAEADSPRPEEKPENRTPVPGRDMAVQPQPSLVKKQSQRKRITRNGFPILDGQDDFSLFMELEKAGENNLAQTVENTSPSGKSANASDDVSNKNKHGIPFLAQEEPWDRRENDSDPEKGEFLRLLNTSLGQKTRDVMMREKGVKTSRNKPLTLKEKLKRFPMPQGQLDLHGYTAIRAEFRAETYLKNASVSQLHTVMIIVGKGLHSDEGAVLPDVIETLLNRLRKEGLILAYEWENETKSRSGAVTVYLNNLAFD